MNTFNAQQIPPSPSVQQSPITQATPSTVGAAGSPMQTPGPLIANADGGVEAKGRRQEKETRMRSSIACCACRRSKTKCDNNGIRLGDGSLAPCKSCVDHKKECTYPAPAPATSQSQRRESTATTAGEEVRRDGFLSSAVKNSTPMKDIFFDLLFGTECRDCSVMSFHSGSKHN